MNLKLSWIPFAASLITVVPIKIYSSVSGNGWDKSAIFLIAVTTMIVITALCIALSEKDVKIIRMRKNLPVGITALLSSALIAWSGVSYLIDATVYNSDRHPLIAAILSFLSAVTFAMIAFSFITGKNLFKKAQIMIFFPSVMLGLFMISFLSMSNNSPDPYNVLQNALFLLFLLYQSQVFITFVNRGTVKRLFLFGMPAIIASVMYNVPSLITDFGNGLDFKYVSVSSCLSFLAISLYMIFLFIECANQIQTPDQFDDDPFPEMDPEKPGQNQQT